MEKKHNRYEKPILDDLDIVGHGDACSPSGPAADAGCAGTGLAASGGCLTTGSSASGGCTTGDTPA